MTPSEKMANFIKENNLLINPVLNHPNTKLVECFVYLMEQYGITSGLSVTDKPVEVVEPKEVLPETE